MPSSGLNVLGVADVSESAKQKEPLKSNMAVANNEKVKVNIKNFAILQNKEIKSTYKIKETLG